MKGWGSEFSRICLFAALVSVAALSCHQSSRAQSNGYEHIFPQSKGVIETRMLAVCGTSL
jgi:hypothetical protein